MVMEQGLIWLGLGLFGLCAGALTAAGYFALITSVGMINRAAAVTGTTKAVFFLRGGIAVRGCCRNASLGI